MKVVVWDTYVPREDGKTMHFDILTPDELKDEKEVFDFGQAYLSTKTFKTGALTARECRFCHIEKASKQVVEEIAKKGYAIIEMENCN